MYKSKLQEFCHKQSWRLPEYSSAIDGPSHNPRFIGSVSVNDLTFHSPGHSSSKIAKNEAAKIALAHFQSASAPSSLSDPSGPGNRINQDSVPPINGKRPFEDSLANSSALDNKGSLDVKPVYKSQLHSYAQKKNLTLPSYSCEKEGPSHDSRFKSKVIVDGQTFESPGLFRTIKEAEQAAAKVALQSLAPDNVEEEDCGFYKNLLQALVQKEGFGVPKYATCISGECHKPTFISTVKIEEEIFQGYEAKTKKQAEMSAAKVAYVSFSARKRCPRPEMVSNQYQASEDDIKRSKTVNFGETGSHVVDEKQSKGSIAMDHEAADTISVNVEEAGSQNCCFVPPQSDSTPTTINRDTSSPSNTVCADPLNLIPVVPASLEDGHSPSSDSDSTPSAEAVDVILSNVEADHATETSKPLGRKIKIFPRSKDTTLLDGVDAKNVLPISDNEWVALEVTPTVVNS